jgi:hypothetical protein
MTRKTAVWLNAVVGIVWIGIALRDLFAPGLFSFSPSTAGKSTIVLDFAAGAAFLFCALCLRQAKRTIS